MRAGRVPRLRRDTHAEKKSSLRYILAMPEPIYLDHAATTPVRPEVREAMEPFFGPRFGNPSSMHRWGREARVALDEARERVAACLGARTDEVCFPSGGAVRFSHDLGTQDRRPEGVWGDIR